jgi:hypothetical protein
MSAASGVPPSLVAWLEAQQALVRLAGAALATNPPVSAAPPSFAEPYRLLFAIPGFPPAAPGTAAPDSSMRRYQQAAVRVGQLLSDAAADAVRRLDAALAADGPDALPITSLRELQTLWIDCGESAWSAAAQREEFAVAQAELLAAWAALRAAGQAG